MRDTRSVYETFLAGGGEMGERVRAFDWVATPLGSPNTWPLPLLTMVCACLNSPMLSTVLWGTDLIMIYNDSYIPSMADRHPAALGRPVADVWGNTWELVAPPFREAMATGRGFAQSHVELPITRHGKAEVTYWNFTATPIRGEDGHIEGLLNQGTEITAEVQAANALRRSDERHRQLLQQMPGFIAVATGPDHVYEYVNDAFVTLAGPRQLIGLGIRDAFPEIAGQGFYELLDQVYATGEPFVAQSVPFRLTGEMRDRFTDLTYQPIRADDGTITGIFVGGYEVTEQNQAAQALRDLNADLERKVTERALARSRTWQLSPDIMGVLNTDGYFEQSNPAWLHVLGYSEEEVAQTVFFDFLHPDDIAASQVAWRDAIDQGKPALRFENRYRHKAGGYRWLSWVAVPDEGKIYCSARDITAERQQAAALGERTAELRLHRDIVQSDTSPILAFDHQYRVLAFNRAHDDDFQRVMGLHQKIGDVLPDLFPPDQAQMLRSLMDRALAGERFVVVEEFGDIDREKPTWEITYTPLHGEEGAIIGAFHHARNISDRVRAEAGLREVQEQLRQSQKMEAVGQLTGGLAHDFNNLLAVVTGSLELLERRIAQGRISEIDRFVVAAQTAARRAATLTQRLLAFSRRQTLDPKPTSVNQLVAGMDDMVRRTVGPQIEIEAIHADDLWTTLVDPGQLENALLNLCINARDAMPDGGRLTITTANQRFDDRTASVRDIPPGQYVALSVSDTGCGMPPEVIAKAFDPFFTTKPIGQGTGLGLSMIYGFARQSGGQVRIHSSVGHGTKVSIFLPRHHGDEISDDAIAFAAPEQAEQGDTVLVVDDEPGVRMLIAAVLEELGYRILEADDGPAAMKIIGSTARIDLLVTDVGLPGGMNGRQVADAALVTRADLKVLFITGYAETAVLNHGNLGPGMSVITKPFAVDDLANRIKGLISESPVR